MTGTLPVAATTKVVIKTSVDVGGTGTYMVLDAEIPCDPDCRLPVAGNWGHLAEAFRSDHVRMGDVLLRRRLPDAERDQEAAYVRSFDARPDNYVRGSELMTQAGRGPVRTTFVAVADEPFRILGDGVLEFQVSIARRKLAEIRDLARRNLLMRPDGLYVAAPECRIVVGTSDEPDLMVAEEPGGTVNPALQFSIDRWDDAAAFLDRLRPGARPRGVPKVRLDEPDLLPTIEPDTVALARYFGRNASYFGSLDPALMDPDTVRAFHDVANRHDILQAEGEPGAWRLLGSIRRLADHLDDMFPKNSHRDTFRHLRARMDFEATFRLDPDLVPARPAP